MKKLCLSICITSMLLTGCKEAESSPETVLPIGEQAGDAELSTFYRWEKSLPENAGVLLNAETLSGLEEVTAYDKAERILYTSTDARWNTGLLPVSGTLFTPKGEVPDKGWPIVAWGHGTLGISDVCAPSWNGFRPRDAGYIDRWLKAGYAVVVSDYQGLGGPGPHPYLYWKSEGRSVLDAVKAVLGRESDLLSNTVLLAGQSQGAGAAMGASILAADYAPDLNIVGAVVTGLNSYFPDGPISLPLRNSNNMFLSFASGGLKDGSPAIEEILSDKGKQILTTARTSCTEDIKKKAYELKIQSMDEVFSISLEELSQMRLPVYHMPSVKIGFPIMVATGLADATVTPKRQYAAVKAMCAVGNTVAWYPYEGLGHDGAMHGSLDDSIEFAKNVVAGQTVEGNCEDISEPGPPGKRREGVRFNDD